MSGVSFQDQPLPEETSGESKGNTNFNNLKSFKAGDGSFEFSNGALKLRDASGNVIIFLGDEDRI